MNTRTLARLATVAIGIWLEAASAVLSYGSPASDIDRLLGPIAAGAAFIALWDVVHMLRWVTIPAGVLLVLAPVLGYPAVATVNSIACGVAITALGFLGPAPDAHFGGSWSVIWRGRQRHPADASR